MYHQKPVVAFEEGDFVHTDSMYHMTPMCSLKCDGARIKQTNELDAFFVHNASARSKLGQALKAKKRPSQKQQKFKSPSSSEPVNEMHLDKYIVRKTAPVSKLGKHLLNRNRQKDCNSTLLHRLQDLERKIDAYLIPMSLIESNRSKSATIKPQTKPVKSEEKSEDISIFTPEVTLPAPISQDFVDLAVHCDPHKPPFALLTYSQMLLISGKNVSVQFYRHSSLTSVPKYLSSLERLFSGKPRSSASDFILSIIWRPCSFGCTAIGNPFRDLPLFGESVILMSIARLTANFNTSFGNLSMVESAVSSKDEKTVVDCINKVGKMDAGQLSPEEVLLFLSVSNSGLSPVIQKSAKPWFDRCMKNDCIAGALKVLDLCC